MATYKGIQGFKIQSRDGDPDNPIVGDFYYDSAGKKFKVVKTGGAPIGAWASGGNLNAPGSNAAGASNGTPTATLVFAGDRPTRSTVTESYNGSAWTEVNDLNTGRNNLGGAGLQGAAIAFGGGTPSATDATEKWNGTSWTEVNNLNS